MNIEKHIENYEGKDEEKLLRGVKETVQSSELTKAEQEYNLFCVLECEAKEVLMCRMLADLLNPKGRHGKGSIYLEHFLKNVLHEPDAAMLSQMISVYKEYPIDEERRIDIVLTGNGRFIPVEVKIYAGEQQAQCCDYYQYAVKRDKDTYVVYLTLHGTMPSKYSLGSKDGSYMLDLSNVKTISFENEIAGWLQELEWMEKNPVLVSTLHQYRQAIRFVSGDLRERQKMDLVNMIISKEDYFRSMIAISEVIDQTKAKLIYTVMTEFEKQMSDVALKYGMIRENRFHWYEYQDKATQDYYHQNNSTYPGINYVIPGVVLSGGAELWFRIEVEYDLFAGLCLFDPSAKSEMGIGNQLDEPSEDVKKSLATRIDTSGAQYDAWWVQWWYLPTGEKEHGAEKERIPNFKTMNEAAIQLSDPKKRAAFIKESVDMIDMRLKQLMLL